LLIKNKHISLIISFLIAIVFRVSAQETLVNKNTKLLNQIENPAPDVGLDKHLAVKDTIQVDTIPKKKKKESLKDIVSHSSFNTIKIRIKDQTTTLYDKAKLHYEDVDLEAGIITIDYKNNLIIATGIKDSLGIYTQKPYFKQDGEESTQDSLIVNFKTKRALIWGARSQQGDLYTGSGVSKKVNDSTVYVRDVFVTSSKKENPDYEIHISKAKLIPNKKIIAGVSQLIIADVPTPAFLPFAYFPLTKTRTSGILIPSYGESNKQGYYLQNGGYYLALSDYFDLALTGDIYTNGSWGMRANTNYAWRYNFSGNFSYSYNNNINSLRGFDDYSKSSNYNIRWTHSQDRAANPNARLSASVNLGSSRFYRESYNEYHNNSYLNNQLNSSVSYSRDFVGTPFHMSLSTTHSQNVNKKTITMSLPSLRINMDRIYPFAPKEGVSTNLLHKLSLGYNMSGDYKINTTDEDFMKKQMFKTAQKDVNHNVNLSTNIKVFKYFSLSPSAKYTEKWYFDYISRRYDTEEQEMQNDTVQGFKAFRKYSTGASVSTNVYGTFKFNKGRLKAIRHTIRPSVSYSYTPDLSFYNEESYNPDTDETIVYSPFGNGTSAISSNMQNRLNFTLNNTFEAKVMPKDSMQTEATKLSLLNSLNFGTSYNMSADTMRWSPVKVSAGTVLFKKLRLNLSATLDPYAITANGSRINKFNINNGGSLFRLPDANATMSYRISSKDFGRKEDEEENVPIDTGIESETKGNKTTNTDSKTKKVKLFYSEIPWNISFSYALVYSDRKLENEISGHTLGFNGDVELSPKWNVGFNSGYDFKDMGIARTRLNFQRDLDSWKMSLSWVPFGERSNYNFFIGVKSSFLSELKYDKQSLPDKKLF